MKRITPFCEVLPSLRWGEPKPFYNSTTMSSRKRRVRGLTLIEVIVAVVVLSMGLMAVAGTLGWVSRSHTKARYQTTASSLAMSELRQLTHDPALPPEAHTYSRSVGKPITELPSDATLSARSEPYPQANELRLRWVEVTISWGEPGDALSGHITRSQLIQLR